MKKNKRMKFAQWLLDEPLRAFYFMGVLVLFAPVVVYSIIYVLKGN